MNKDLADTDNGKDLTLISVDRLDRMQGVIYQTAKEHGWWEGKDLTCIPEKLALIHSEVSEALEDFRNGKNITEITYDENGKPDGFPTEMADIVIRVMDLCEFLGVDLSHAIALKHNYNLTRSYRHGGKVV